MTEDVVISPRIRTVWSYSRGQHMPSGYRATDGWRCRDCGQRLRTYVTDHGDRRLRHYGPRPA